MGSIKALAGHIAPWLLLAIAVGLWLTAWGQLVVTLVERPAPWQVVTTQLPTGGTVRGSYGFRCGGVTLVRDDRLWRWPCMREPRPGVTDTHLVEIDLRQRSARSLSATDQPGSTRHGLAGLAEHPDGRLALLTADLARYQLMLIRPGESAATSLDLPAPLADDRLVRGLSWVGDGLELVVLHASDGLVTLHRHEPATGWQSPRQPPQPDCPAAERCRLELAYREGNEWQLLFSRHPRRPTAPDSLPTTLLLGTLQTAPRPIATLTLQRSTGPAIGQYELDADGAVTTTPLAMDRSLGNLTSGWSRGAPLVRAATGSWQPLVVPTAELRAQYDQRLLGVEWSVFQRAGDHLVWVPQGRGEWGARALAESDGWAVLLTSFLGSAEQERVRFARLRAPPGPALLDSGFGPSEMAPVVPASGGGYWYVSQFGNHIRVGPDLQRADPLGPLERLLRLAEADRLYRHDFFETDGLAKTLTGQAILWLLPLWLAAAALWRAWRRPATPWRQTILPIALAVIAISLLGAGWFAELLRLA